LAGLSNSRFPLDFSRDLPSIFERALPALDKDDLATFADDLEETRQMICVSPEPMLN
jgi:hypothetical protein